MEVPLPRLLVDHPGFLQQILADVPAYGVALEIEVDVHVLPEPGRVVVAVSLGVSESLQDGIRLDKDVLHPLYLLLASYDRKKIRIRR